MSLAPDWIRARGGRPWSIALALALVIWAQAPAAAQAPIAAPSGTTPSPLVSSEPPKPPATFPALGPTNELRLGENFSIRPGFQLQHWTELLQDRTRRSNGEPGNYQWNTYVRRARFILGGTIFQKVSFFGLLEAANVGRTSTAADGTATKTFDTLTFRDAFASLNLDTAFSIQAGLMVVPFSRQTLASTVHYLTLDTLTTAATFITQTQTSALRDTGVQLKGYPLEGHLEYRFGFFQGIRQSATQMAAQGGKNPFRLTGYVQYNALDTEAGYTLPSQYFGHKNVLGAGVGFDYQKLRHEQSYWAVSASAFAALRLNGDPKSGGDELAAFAHVLHFDPGTTLQPPPAPGGVAKQNDFAAELSYYNRDLSASVFGKFELRLHQQSEFEAGDLQIFGAGLKYFISEANANITLAYNRTVTPNAPATTNSVNQFVLQFQAYYY